MSTGPSSRPGPGRVAATLLLWALVAAAFVLVVTWLMMAAAMSDRGRVRDRSGTHSRLAPGYFPRPKPDVPAQAKS